MKTESIDKLITSAWAITGLNDQPEEVQAHIRAATLNNAAQYEQEDGSLEFPDEVLLAWAEH